MVGSGVADINSQRRQGRRPIVDHIPSVLVQAPLDVVQMKTLQRGASSQEDPQAFSIELCARRGESEVLQAAEATELRNGLAEAQVCEVCRERKCVQPWLLAGAFTEVCQDLEVTCNGSCLWVSLIEDERLTPCELRLSKESSSRSSQATPRAQPFMPLARG